MSVNMPSLPRLPSKAKFWKKKSSSANLTDVDPSYRAIYLGNVLTGWAKGNNVPTTVAKMYPSEDGALLQDIS